MENEYLRHVAFHVCQLNTMNQHGIEYAARFSLIDCVVIAPVRVPPGEPNPIIHRSQKYVRAAGSWWVSRIARRWTYALSKVSQMVDCECKQTALQIAGR